MRRHKSKPVKYTFSSLFVLVRICQIWILLEIISSEWSIGETCFGELKSRLEVALGAGGSKNSTKLECPAGVWLKGGGWVHLMPLGALVMCDLLPRFIHSAGSIVRYMRVPDVKIMVALNEVSDMLMSVFGAIGCGLVLSNSETFTGAVMDAVAILYVLNIDNQYLEAVLELFKLRQLLKQAGYDPKEWKSALKRGDTKTEQGPPAPAAGGGAAGTGGKQPAALPPGWTQGKDQTSGKAYYIHQPTGRTQWNKP